jgi:hypothetical protein
VQPSHTQGLIRDFLLSCGYRDTLRSFEAAAGLTASPEAGADGMMMQVSCCQLARERVTRGWQCHVMNDKERQDSFPTVGSWPPYM